MNAAQMFQHLNSSFDSVISKEKVKRMFLGRILGKVVLKKVMKNKYLFKNSPTAPSYKASESANFSIEKEKWVNHLNRISTIPENDLDGIIHPFFGKNEQ